MFAMVFGTKVVSYAETVNNISFIYSTDSETGAIIGTVGIDLNGNSVIIRQGDNADEIHLIIDKNRNGIIDSDESAATFGSDNSTGFPSNLPIYGWRSQTSTVDIPISITMLSGKVHSIYGVWFTDMNTDETAVTIDIQGGTVTNTVTAVMWSEITTNQDDVAIDVNLNSANIGYFNVLDRSVCNGDLVVCAKDSVINDEFHVLYEENNNKNTVTGDFTFVAEDLNVTNTLWVAHKTDFANDVDIYIENCHADRIMGLYFCSFISDSNSNDTTSEARLDFINCITNELEATYYTNREASVKNITDIIVNVSGGEFGYGKTSFNNFSLISADDVNNYILNVSDVKSSIDTEIDIFSQANAQVDISNSEIEDRIRFSGSTEKEDYNDGMHITLTDTKISNIGIENAIFYILKNQPLEIDYLTVYDYTKFVLEDTFKFNNPIEDVYDVFLINEDNKPDYYFNGGTMQCYPGSDVYYGINSSAIRDLMTDVKCNKTIAFPNVEDVVFALPNDSITYEFEPLDSVEIETVKFETNDKDFTDEVVIKDSKYQFLMPEKPVFITAIEKENPNKNDSEIDNPGTDTPGTDTPGTDTPGTDTPGTDTPGTDNPGTNNPGVESPVINESEDDRLAIGTKIKDKSSKGIYTVSKVGAEVYFVKPTEKNVKKIKIPATIKYNGITYKVVGINDKAFVGCKKLKEVTIGKNISYIGKKAFYGCKALKSITFKTNKLTSKKVGSKAFTGTNSKVTIKINKKKYKSYKSFLKKKGVSKKAKYKKI